MGQKRKNRHKEKANPDGKLNLVTAVINFIIALINIFAIMKLQ